MYPRLCHNYLHPQPRYLSRCILLPCIADSPNIELDVLNTILQQSVAAFPHALHIGKAVLATEAEVIYHMRDCIHSLFGEGFNSCLATHYAMIAACALQVA